LVVNFLSALAAVQLLVLASAGHLRNTRDESREAFFNFDYSNHGQDWTAGSCSSRNRQSPIDLPPAAPIVGLFQFKYNPITEPFDVMNTGHNFAIDVAGLNYGGITYDDKYHFLMNINVHAGSEHTWNGVQKPLELHLVHKRYDGEALLIIAIPLEGTASAASAMQINASSQRNLRIGGEQAPPAAPMSSSSGYIPPNAGEPNFNPNLQMFLTMEPPQANSRVSVPASAAFNLNNLMGGSPFYEYSGSLTAPPCAEIVTWLVRKNTVKASDKQISYLRGVIAKITSNQGNYRTPMPLSGRLVSMRQSMVEPLSITPGPSVGDLESRSFKSDREIRAMKWALEAFDAVDKATDYISDVDVRLRKTALEHVKELERKRERGVKDTMKPNLAIKTRLPPVPMEKTAKVMARTLAAQAPEDAPAGMSRQEAKQVAMQAAKDAGDDILTSEVR